MRCGKEWRRLEGVALGVLLILYALDSLDPIHYFLKIEERKKKEKERQILYTSYFNAVEVFFVLTEDMYGIYIYKKGECVK